MVLDIETQEGNSKEFNGSAGISPITTHVLVEGPIIKDTLPISLLHVPLTQTGFSDDKDPALHNSRASFYDLNGKITYDINKNNKIDISIL